MDFKAVDLYLLKLKNGKKQSTTVDDADLADYLETIKEKDEEKFFEYLNTLPIDIKAQTFIELPISFQIDLILKYESTGLADILESLQSDDATDLFIVLEKTDKQKSEDTFLLLSDARQKTIEKLISYLPSEVGSLMQTEIFKVSSTRTIEYAINKLSKLKKDGIGRVQSVFITNDKGHLLNSINIDDIIVENNHKTFDEILKKYPQSYSIASHETIDKAIKIFEKYDLVNLAVIDRTGHLIGRVTHDDIVDMMRDRSTKQIYKMNNIDEDEQLQENFSKTTKTRAIWLTINLVNAVIASLVIGIFEHTLEAIVALAVLMPIVANMAGTASVQTMTVIVRQMGIGEIGFKHLQPILKKEITISFLNGILFAILSFTITQLWFDQYLISLAIAMSMFVSFLSAGVLGATVPMILKRFNLDPAVASSVVVITLVDIIGFFSFLWFAQIMIL